MMNSIMNIGLQGMNNNIQDLQQTANNITTSFIPEDGLHAEEEHDEDLHEHDLQAVQQNTSIEQDMVNMITYQRGFEASIAVVQAGNEIAGNSLDIMA